MRAKTDDSEEPLELNEKLSPQFTIMNVEGGFKHKCPERCPLDLYKIILSCLETIPEDRSDFTTLVAALTGLRHGSPAAPPQNNGNSVLLVQPSPTVATSGYLDGLQEIPTSPNATPEPAPASAPAPGLMNRLYSDAAYVATDANRIDKMIAALSETPVLSLREAVAKAEPHCKRSFETEVAFATRFAEVYVESESGKKHAAGMTVTDVSAIHFYSQETVFYSKMNGVMGGYGPDGTAPLPQYLPYIRLLTIAMGKLEQISAVGYRAIRNVSVDTLLQGKGIGGRIVWPAFTSCTLDPDVLRDSAFLGIGSSAGHGERIVCKLHISTAVPIEHFSEMGSSTDYYLTPVGVFEQNEKEMLLFPGTTLEIIAITPFDGVTEIELREVPTTREFPDHLVHSVELAAAPLEAAPMRSPPRAEALGDLQRLLSPHHGTEPVKTCVKTATYNPRDKVLQLTRDDVSALQVAVGKVTVELQTMDASAIDDASRRIDQDLRRTFRARNNTASGDDSLVPLKTRLTEAEQLLDHYAHRLVSECTLPLESAAVVLGSLQAIVIDPVVLLVKEEIVTMCKDVCMRPKAYKAEVKALGDDDKGIYALTFNKMVKNAADRHAYHQMNAAADVMQAESNVVTEAIQPVKDLLMLTIKVREAQPKFEDVVSKALAGIEGVDPPQFRRKTKALYRMIEKGLLKGPKSELGVEGLLGFSAADLDCSQVLDVFGCLVVCQHFKAMQDAIEHIGSALASSRGSGTICRIKNRWKEETGGGWKDLMLNVEVDGVVFEMQLVHIELYNARKLMGGHKAYAEYRCYLELLTFTGQLGVEIDPPADIEKYDVVFSHTHEQLPFVEELIQSLPHGLKCFSENNLDKTNPDHWPFEWRSAYKDARVCVCVLTREYLVAEAKCTEWAVTTKGGIKRIVIAAGSVDSITAGLTLSKENTGIINHLEAGYNVESRSRSTVNELGMKIQQKMQCRTGAKDDAHSMPQQPPGASVQLAAPIDILVVVDFPMTADGAALEPATYVAPFRKLKEALDNKFKGKQVRARFHTPRSLVANDAALLSMQIPCVCWVAMGEEAPPDADAVFTSSLWKQHGGKCSLAIVFMKHGAEWVAEQLHANRTADRVVWLQEEYSAKVGTVLLTKKVPEVLLKALSGANFGNKDEGLTCCNSIFDFAAKRDVSSGLLLQAEDGMNRTGKIEPVADGDRQVEADDAGISLHRVGSDPPNLSVKTFGLQTNVSVDLNQWPSSRSLQAQLVEKHHDGWRFVGVTGGEVRERKTVVWDAVQSFQEPWASGKTRFDLIVFRDITGISAEDWDLPFDSHSDADVLVWLDTADEFSAEELNDACDEWSDELLPWTFVVTAGENEGDEDGKVQFEVVADDCTVLPNVVVPSACGTTLNDSCADLMLIEPAAAAAANPGGHLELLGPYHIDAGDLEVYENTYVSLGSGHFAVVDEGYRMDAPSRTLLRVQHLMIECWQRNPTDRPTMADIVDCFEEIKRHAQPAYAALTAAYPSTVGMFASVLEGKTDRFDSSRAFAATAVKGGPHRPAAMTEPIYDTTQAGPAVTADIVELADQTRERHVEPIISIQDKRVPQFIGEGDRMALMGKHDEAQRSYSIALQLSENRSSHAFSRRATSHIKLKNWQAAAKDATAALEIDHNDAEAYTARAQACCQNGSFGQAATDFESAFFFAPSDENQENLQRCLRALYRASLEQTTGEEERESSHLDIENYQPDNDGTFAYPTLTATYPSTIQMFATALWGGSGVAHTESNPINPGTRDKFDMKHQDIKIVKPLGSGNFGVVNLGTIVSTGASVTVKQCKEAEVQELVCNYEYRMSPPKGTPHRMGKLMAECWQLNVQDRPMMVDIVACFEELKATSAALAYPTLTVAYPSTIGMFAVASETKQRIELVDQTREKRDVKPMVSAYSTLTSAYPSTIGMFATALGENVNSFPWMYGKLTAKAAEHILGQHGGHKGLFLVYQNAGNMSMSTCAFNRSRYLFHKFKFKYSTL
eukprot:gene6316-30056_t